MGESRWSATVEVRETIAPVGGVLDAVQPRLRYRTRLLGSHFSWP